MAQIQATINQLTKGIVQGTAQSPAFNEFDDYMRENSQTWRRESRHYFTEGELHEAFMEGFVDGKENNPYSVTLAGRSITVNKGSLQVLKLTDLANTDDWNFVVPVNERSLPDGFAKEGDKLVNRLRNVSEAVRAATRLNLPNFDKVIAVLRSSQTYRGNYDNSFVTPTELLIALGELRSEELRAANVAFQLTDGVVSFYHNGAFVVGFSVNGVACVLHIPNTYGPALTEGWSLVE